MAKIQVTVTDQPGRSRALVTLPGDELVQSLLEVLPRMLDFPLERPGGELIGYRLFRDGVVLPLEETLSSFGVRNNDTLCLSSEPAAGMGRAAMRRRAEPARPWE